MDWATVEELLDGSWAAVEDAFETGEPGKYDDDAREACVDLQSLIHDTAQEVLKEAADLPHHRNLRDSSPGEYEQHRRENRTRFIRMQRARMAMSWNRRMVSAGFTLAHKRSRYNECLRCLHIAATYEAPRY